MGIPFYFQVIVRAHPHILLQAPPHAAACKDLFLDFNGAIHQAVRRVLTEPAPTPDADPDALEERMMGAVWTYFTDLMTKAAPSGDVHICIDGVAPVAKMLQQRKRRYLSVLRPKLGAGAVAAAAPIAWDTNAISPGTPFMSRLQAFLRARIREHPQGPRIKLSAADEPGEGEHKMFASIAAIPHEEPVYIYGLDADLFMLSLLSHRRRIFLMREPTGPAGAGGADDGFLYVDVDALRAGILRELGTKHGWPDCAAGGDASLIIESYIVLCFLLGNDFLPHVPTLHLQKGGLARILEEAGALWRAYGHGPVMAGTGGGPVLSWAFLAGLLQKLAEDEDDVIWKINAEYLKKRPFPTTDPTESYPLVHKDPLAQEIYDLPQPSRWRVVYYQRLFSTRRNDTSVIATACNQFLQGMEWTFRYYRRVAKDPWWSYPYEFSPSLRDLANYAALFQAAPAAVPAAGATTGGFVEPHLQLLCILPPESAHLLPTRLRRVMTDPALGCAHMFPTKYPIRTFWKTRLWECAPVLPPLDLPLLRAAIRAAGAP